MADIVEGGFYLMSRDETVKVEDGAKVKVLEKHGDGWLSVQYWGPRSQDKEPITMNVRCQYLRMPWLTAQIEMANRKYQTRHDEVVEKLLRQGPHVDLKVAMSKAIDVERYGDSAVAEILKGLIARVTQLEENLDRAIDVMEQLTEAVEKITR